MKFTKTFYVDYNFRFCAFVPDYFDHFTLPDLKQKLCNGTYFRILKHAK